MKRILIVCLLGMGLLLPTTTITAKEEFKKRVVDFQLEGEIATITSNGSTGTLVQINIYDNQERKVFGEALSGSLDYVDLSSLPNGSYTAHIAATGGNYTEGFALY